MACIKRKVENHLKQVSIYDILNRYKHPPVLTLYQMKTNKTAMDMIDLQSIHFI